jgi:hypothetical protein
VREGLQAAPSRLTLSPIRTNIPLDIHHPTPTSINYHPKKLLPKARLLPLLFTSPKPSSPVIIPPGRLQLSQPPKHPINALPLDTLRLITTRKFSINLPRLSLPNNCSSHIHHNPSPTIVPLYKDHIRAQQTTKARRKLQII